jgi:hypothetical protein
LSTSQHLGMTILGLYSAVKEHGHRVPILTGYGNGVSIERVRFQIDRVALTVDYSVIPDEDEHSSDHSKGLEGLQVVRESKRLTRSIECVLPASEGWDVQVSTKASSELVEKLPWTVRATRDATSTGGSSAKELDKLMFNVKHSSLPDNHSILKVRVVIEKSGPSNGLRLNGIPHKIDNVEERDLMSLSMPQEMAQDASSAAQFSMQSISTMSTADSSIVSNSSQPIMAGIVRSSTERTVAAHKSILSRVKRNYIYFSSLLQEPEAKWKRSTPITEAISRH